MRRKLGILCVSLLGVLQAFGQANPVTYAPAPGTYPSAQLVTLSTTTSGTIIFYTTDGSTPDISSTQYTGPINVTSSMTIKAIAAVVGVNQKNAQNNNPSSGGTFWKPVDCASYPAWSSTTTYAVGDQVSNGGTNYTASASSTNKSPASNPSIWAVWAPCATANNPGGAGVATATTHTSGNASPSLSGASMKFAETAALNQQTNVLWTVHSSFGACDGCTQFLETHDYYWPSSGNSSANEDDSFMFDNTDQIRYMAGMQYCFSAGGCPGGASGWDYGGNSNVPWTFSGVTAGATRDTWHHLQRLITRVLGEVSTKPCTAAGSWPYVYFNYLRIDGVTFNNGGPGWKFCANALPTGWSSVASMQAQIDISSHSTTTSSTVYWDNIGYLATYPPSTLTAATYAIGGGTIGPPVHMSGTAKISGSAKIQ
jgi:hypothetical protein